VKNLPKAKLTGREKQKLNTQIDHLFKASDKLREYEKSLDILGSITTNGLPSDAPEYGGENTNSTIEVDAKKNPSSSTWDGWTEYTSWDD
jgi:hypothetical protein